jgi:tetratricopeptide (TPR) repeat protein
MIGMIVRCAGEVCDMSESSESEKSEKPLSDAERLAADNAAAAEQLELKLPDESSAPKDIALWAGVLALLTLIAYWQATSGSFLWRDDATGAAPQILAPGAISRIWFERWQDPKAFSEPMYQPVAWIAYWLEYQLGGHTAQGAPVAMAYHIGGLIFHAGAAILLWLVLRELKMPGAWLIAGIFVLHPIHAEAVSWISEQPIVLAGMCSLGSVYCYLLFLKYFDRDVAERAAGQPGVDPAVTWGLFAGSIILCPLAMLSHPSAVVLPAIILLIVWWKRKLVAREIAVWSALLLVGLVLWFANADLHATTATPSLIRAIPILQAAELGRGFTFSVLKMVAPIRLSVIYPSTGSTLWLFPLALVAGLLVFSYLRPGHRGLFVVIASFALLVAASMNWFDSSRFSYFTDGTAYLAMIPLTVLGIGIVSSSIGRGAVLSPPIVVGLSTVLLIMLGTPAWFRTHVFESPVAMWSDTLNKNPDSVMVEASLAEQFRLKALADSADQDKVAMENDFARAIDHAKAVLQRAPTNSRAQHTWANVLVAQGDDAGALPHFQAAIQSDPDNPQLRAEFGSALVTLGRFLEAIPQLNQALVQDFASGIAHRLLGKAYAGLGNTDRAIIEEKTALSISPGDLAAWELLADAQSKAGKLKDAIESYAHVLADPSQQNRTDVWLAIASLKDRQGDYDLAVQYMQTAEQIAHAAVEKANTDQEQTATSQLEEKLKKQLAAEIEKQKKAAATRPTTRSTTTQSAQ